MTILCPYCGEDVQYGFPHESWCIVNPYIERAKAAELDRDKLAALLTPTEYERDEMACAGYGHENDDIVTWLRESRQATRDRADSTDAEVARLRQLMAQAAGLLMDAWPSPEDEAIEVMK